MIENKQRRPILIAGFSAILGGGSNSPIKRLAFRGILALPSADHESRFTRHLPLSTRNRPNQSLAKHNRKPLQIIENNQRRCKSIASFCRVFHARSERRANTTQILINAAAIKGLRNFLKTNNGGQF
jgi:hypothetical protein